MIELTPPACDREKRFNADVCKLREWWGTRDFWGKPRKIALAKKAIATQYLTGNFAAQDRVAVTFEATMLEFNRRALMVGVDLGSLPAV